MLWRRAIKNLIQTINLLDIFPVNESTFCIKFPNLRYSYYPMYQGEYPLIPDISLEPNLDKDILVLPYTEKYFHTFFEYIPKILFLKHINPALMVIFVADDKSFVNEENNIFYAWGENVGSHREDHLKDFLDRSRIKYMCTYKDSDFLKNMIARSGYIFYDSIKKINMKRWQNDFYKFPSSISYFATCSQTTETLLPMIKYLKGINAEEVTSFRSIYISRKNFPERSLENEKKLEEFMISSGYEVYCFEDMNIFDQIKLTKESKRIVILNGSSAANCVLANPGTEVFSFNNGAEIVGLYEDACKKYEIKYNLIEMSSNNAEWIIDYLKKNNLDKP